MSKFYQDLEIVMGRTEDCVSVKDQISSSLVHTNNPVPIIKAYMQICKSTEWQDDWQNDLSL